MIQLENGVVRRENKGSNTESWGAWGRRRTAKNGLENTIKFITHCEMQVESVVSWKYARVW